MKDGPLCENEIPADGPLSQFEHRRPTGKVVSVVGFDDAVSPTTVGSMPDPGVLFTGELMVCTICAAETRSDAKTEDNWRAIEFQETGEVYYFCPRHFPPAGAAENRHARAYKECIRAIDDRRLRGLGPRTPVSEN